MASPPGVTSRTGGVAPSAALLDAFVETSDDAMVSHDADWNVTTWNQTAERLFGYPAEERRARAALAALVALVFVVRSLPDLARYRAAPENVGL